MKEYVLVTTDFNWADEIDFEGFRVYEKSDWEAFKERLKAVRNYRFGWGSNEDSEYLNYEDVMCHVKVEDLLETEATILTRLFKNWQGNCEFGAYPLEGCVEYEEENYDEDEEEE